ncbi:hypothetical protein RJ641_000828 [Dillenia turbinata]|uniref:Uncharacterized protein n=1 Tax=Dillenia turbinata TaxID=194707 RepID=A0AAN8ZW45_9MAGN
MKGKPMNPLITFEHKRIALALMEFYGTWWEDPGSIIIEANKPRCKKTNGDISHMKPGSNNVNDFIIGLSGDLEVDGVPDLQEQERFCINETSLNGASDIADSFKMLCFVNDYDGKVANQVNNGAEGWYSVYQSKEICKHVETMYESDAVISKLLGSKP